jgi:uncharacterized repeat protein (TIGR01451 family)
MEKPLYKPSKKKFINMPHNLIFVCTLMSKSIPGTINVSSNIPNTFTPVGDAPFQINGNSVTLAIPGSTITTTPTTFTLRLKPNICVPNISSLIVYNISGPLGVGLGVQNCYKTHQIPTQNNTSISWSVKPEAPCLQVSKTTLTPTIGPGGQALFQVTVQNTGFAAANNVQVIDNIPAGFTVASTPQNSTTSGNTITTNVSSIGIGQSWTGTYTLQHTGTVDLCNPQTFINCAKAAIPSCNYMTAPSCSNVTVQAAVVPPVPGFTITEIDCNTFQFTSTDTGPGLTHVWNFGDGSATSTNANPTHDYTADGSYTVTHTVTRCGLTTTQTLSVSSICTTSFSCPCAAPGLNIDASANPNGTLWSSIPQLQGLSAIDLNNYGNCISIRGRLIIDVPGVSFSDSDNSTPSELRMQPGAILQVNGNRSLSITGLNIHGCGQMWRSIRVRQLGYLTLRGNIISDAEFAVEAFASNAPISSALRINIGANDFINNHVGIIVRSPSGNGQGTLSHVINGNKFRTSIAPPPMSSLLLPFTPNLANYSPELGYAGVVALNKRLTVTTANEFSNLRNGMIADQCDISCLGNGYKNIVVGTIQPPEPPSFDAGARGNGILATGGKIIANGSNFSSVSTCIRGVRNEIQATSNNMSSIERGIFGEKVRSCQIFNNQIDLYTNCGIFFSLIDPNGAGYTITNNTSNSSLLSTSGLADHRWAIGIDGGSAPSSVIQNISNNNFTIENRTGGVRVRNSNDWTLVKNNHFYLGGPGTQNAGFSFENASDNQLSQNRSVGSNNHPSYVVNNSRNNVFCCNYAEDVSRGFSFTGMCQNTSLRYNVVSGPATNCLFFSAATQISPQDNFANRFLDGFASHQGVPEDVQESKFTVNDLNSDLESNPPDAPFFPADGATQGLFGPDETGINDSNCGLDPVCVAIGGIQPEIKIISTDLFDANPPRDSTTRSLTQIWEGQRHLYKRLTMYPELLGQSEEVDQYYLAQMQHGVTRQFEQAEQRLYNIQQIPIVWAESLKSLRDSLSVLDDAATEILKQLAFVHTAEDSAAVYYQADVVQTTGGQWLTQQDSIYDLVRIWQRNEATLLLPALEALPEALLHDTGATPPTGGELPEKELAVYNRKAMMIAIAHILASDDFSLKSSEIIADITEIAPQCPLDGGSAVFIARELYAAYIGDQTYDDEANCNTEERSKPTNQAIVSTVSRLLLYPNPANDRLEVRWEGMDVVGGVLNLWSSEGRLVHRQVINTESNSASINTAEYTSGLYFCQYRDHSGAQKTGIVLIQH